MSRIDQQIADLVTATDAEPRSRLVFEISVVTLVVLFLISFVIAQKAPISARFQSMEAFMIWMPARADLVAWRAERGQWPTSSEQIDTESLFPAHASGITRSVELGEGGTLTVVFGDEAPVEGLRGRRLSFRPAVPTADPGLPLFWFCGSRRLPEGFAPSGQDLSDVRPEYLSSSCKDFPRP